jgi:hypothetical protein
MATKRTVKRRTAVSDLAKYVGEYLLNRSMREKSEYWEGRLKANLMEILEATGELQEGGHRQIDLDSPLPYVQYKGEEPKTKSITGIQRKRREHTSLNEDRTMTMLKRKKLMEQCTTTIVVIDEDAVLAANYEGKITDKELAALYDKSENFAFYLVEGET